MTLLLTLLAKPFIPGPPPAALSEAFEKVCGAEDETPSHRMRDVNRDGYRESLLSRWQGGSGWSETCTCLSDGESGQVSCGTWENTVYASFSGWRRAGFPYVPPSYKGPLAGPEDCKAPDRESRAQAGLWLLEQAPEPSAKSSTLSWHAGKPVDQASVCLSVAQARTLNGGLSWEPSGELLDEDSRVVVYQPPSGTALGGPQGEKLWDQSPDGDTQIYSVGHALVVVQTKAKRHAWVLNAEGLVPEHHKVDRWSSISAAKLEGELVRVTLVGQAQKELLIRLE